MGRRIKEIKTGLPVLLDCVSCTSALKRLKTGEHGTPGHRTSSSQVLLHSLGQSETPYVFTNLESSIEIGSDCRGAGNCCSSSYAITPSEVGLCDKIGQAVDPSIPNAMIYQKIALISQDLTWDEHMLSGLKGMTRENIGNELSMRLA